jgi:hypothetical protein
LFCIHVTYISDGFYSSQEVKKKQTLFRLMSENIRVRKRARDIAIRIADQIEDEKQGVDPDDLAPLVPLEEPTPAVTKAWAHRAGLAPRRRQEFIENEITAAEAQDCMETTAMLVLEHANFDSMSSFLFSIHIYTPFQARVFLPYVS